ncbi:unnamed protein product [Pieris macdunnoughi]|uniref:Uncharacterized protein n=1 Tax=Pieris macdunnoughi TaxID=345717 RepID=A0A821NBV0_9NEOP|nr:unnamed protein product [Pieris macdunnoughi]
MSPRKGREMAFHVFREVVTRRGWGARAGYITAAGLVGRGARGDRCAAGGESTAVERRASDMAARPPRAAAPRPGPRE